MIDNEREGPGQPESPESANDDGSSGDEAKKDVWDWGLSDVQNVVGDIVGSLRSLPSIAARSPGHDLIEVPDEGYWVLMDMPGVEKADLDVSMAGDELKIAGRRERPELPEGSEVVSTGRAYGRFSREVRMPSDVDHEGVRAKLENGVLRVVLPRRAERAPQKVEIEE